LRCCSSDCRFCATLVSACWTADERVVQAIARRHDLEDVAEDLRRAAVLAAPLEQHAPAQKRRKEIDRGRARG
jgi:hypothetical protein